MFRLIEDSFWDDPQIAVLSKDEKIVTVCLFANPHTRPCGIYRIGIDRIAAMTKVDVAAIQKVFRRLEESDIAYYDGLEVCIPGYVRKQRYKGPQMAHRIAVELAQVKNKSYVKMIVDRYPDFLKMGGFKLNGLEIQSPQGDLKLEATGPAKAPTRGLGDLIAYVATRLRFTGGVKSTILAQLIKQDPDGEAGVRAAVKRAEVYFATAKAEKWHSYVMARRFSKFCDFYGEAFSSDEALQIYIEKIRLSNDREKRKDEWHKKREGALQVGAQRPEPTTVSPWPEFMGRLPEKLEPMRKDFEVYGSTRKGAARIEDRLLAIMADDGELNAKQVTFLHGLKKSQRTPEMIRRYRLNYIAARFGIPALDEAES